MSHQLGYRQSEELVEGLVEGQNHHQAREVLRRVWGEVLVSDWEGRSEPDGSFGL